MRRRSAPFVAFALCLLLQSAASSTQKPAPDVPSEALRQQLAVFDTSVEDAVSVIVELADEPAAVHARRGGSRETQLNKIRTERGNVFSQLRRRGIDVSPKHEFELAYNGFSMTLPANKLPLLADVPGIVGIHPNPEAIPESVHDTLEINAQPELVNGVPAIQAPAAWAAGYRGQGMRIAIIDDGVDYTHPDLGGCLGVGCKVVGGYDFVQLDNDPQEGYTPEGTPPVQNRDYHGTHVASIAAGLKGVAPDANILAVRVLGTGSISNLDTVMAGVEFALRNDVDVINMSIGFQNTTAHSNNPYAMLTGNVVSSGVVWVNSNGNDGASGPYRPNMYGASPLVIATGNADARPSGFPRTTVVATGQVLIGGSFGTPFPPALLGLALPVVDVGFGNTPAAYAGKDVAGKLVIASRGGAVGEDATFVNKGNQALAAGAAGLVISNNVAGDFATAALAVPSFTVSQANGLLIRANPLVTVESFNPGPQIAAGSSRGPTTDLLIKPDVSAPGTSVVAAVPLEVSPTGYAALSGTSMASPHVAGAAVLLRQAHPDWTPTQVKLALMNTSRNLSTLTGVTFRAIEQGAGFIDINRALQPALVASPGSLTFGQLGPSNAYSVLRQVAVSSGGDYAVGVEWVRTYTGITATPSVAQVGAGPATVGLTLSIQPAAPAGEYEGYLTFTNTTDAADKYRVPFLAVHAIPVSQFQLSKTFARSSAVNTDSVVVNFSAGVPLADWYLGSFPSATGAHTRLSLNQGAVPAGQVQFTWDARSVTLAGVKGNLGGVWSVGIHYRLVGSSTFSFGTAYGRMYMDSTAPQIFVDTGMPSLTNNPQLTVVGAVGDTGMWSFGEVGGGVFVNGQRADLYPRAPAVTFAANNELAYEKTITLAEGLNTIEVYAQDAAGNRSAVTRTFTVVLDSIPPVITFSGARTYTVDEEVLVTCTATDSGSGIATTTCGGAPLLQSPAWLLSLGPHTVSATATDVAGNTTTASATATVIVTHDSLAALTARFVGDVLGNSLYAKLDASEDAAASGNVGASNNMLSAFQNELAAQSGKKISAEQASLLAGLAEALKR